MRYWLHAALGKVDAAVIVAGGGMGATVADLHAFSRVADGVVAHATRAMFVWCSDTWDGLDEDLAPEDALVLRLLRGMYRVLTLDACYAELVFGGADVLLLPDAARERVAALAPVVDLAGDNAIADAVAGVLRHCAPPAADALTGD
jgi:hypothetical protein